jgi:hypothetical protein
MMAASASPIGDATAAGASKTAAIAVVVKLTIALPISLRM